MKEVAAERRRYTLAELETSVGEVLGVSGWLTITQERIDHFAEATGDFAPIHVDVEGSRSGPFGGTIAHGFLTLSVIAPLTDAAIEITDAAEFINYGVNRVRFPTPVPAGARVRLATRLAAYEPHPKGALLTLAFEMELEGAHRPAAVGETLLLVFKKTAQ